MKNITVVMELLPKVEANLRTIAGDVQRDNKKRPSQAETVALALSAGLRILDAHWSDRPARVNVDVGAVTKLGPRMFRVELSPAASETIGRIGEGFDAKCNDAAITEPYLLEQAVSEAFGFGVYWLHFRAAGLDDLDSGNVLTESVLPSGVPARSLLASTSTRKAA
jgi:hypothetical protein